MADGMSIRFAWQVVGELDLRQWAKLAEQLTTTGNTMAVFDALGDRVPRGPVIVATRALLDEAGDSLTIAWPEPVTATTLRAWAKGTQPIPQWAARAMLHDRLEDALNAFVEDDEDEDESDEDEDEDNE